jgi:hypothetical protein
MHFFSVDSHKIDFGLFKKIPQIPRRKRIIEDVKYFTKSIIRISFLKANSISSQAHADSLTNQYCFAFIWEG